MYYMSQELILNLVLSVPFRRVCPNSGTFYCYMVMVGPSLITFKSSLKTHFYSVAFNSLRDSYYFHSLGLAGFIYLCIKMHAPTCWQIQENNLFPPKGKTTALVNIYFPARQRPKASS